MLRTLARALLGAGMLLVSSGCPGYDATKFEEGGRVTAVVTVEDEPLAGVEVALDYELHVGTTDESGRFTWSDLEYGDHIVMLLPGGYPEDVQFDPITQQVVLEESDRAVEAPFDGTYIRTGAITGRIYYAVDTGMNGIPVTLVGPDGEQTTTSSETGEYGFTELRKGDFTVSIPDDIDPDLTCDNGCSHDVSLDVQDVFTLDFPCSWAEPSVEITNVTDADGNTVDGSTPAVGLLNFEITARDGEHTGEVILLLIDGETAATAPYARQVTIPVRTDRLEGSTADSEILPEEADLDGTPVRGQWSNGEHTARAGFTARALEIWEQDAHVWESLNTDEVVVGVMDNQGCTTVGEAIWCGGADVRTAATPVLYTPGTDVGSVSLQIAAGTQTPSGSGTIALDQTTDAEAPFVFTLPAASNAGGPEDLAGTPDGPGGLGSEITVTEVLDATGASILSSLESTPLVDFFVDFDPPEGGGEIALGGSGIVHSLSWGDHLTGSVDDGTFAFILPGVTDDGVGGTFDAASDHLAFHVVAHDGTIGAELIQITAEMDGTAYLYDQPNRVLVARYEDALGNAPSEITIPQSTALYLDFLGPTVTTPATGNGTPPVFAGQWFDLRLEDPRYDPDDPYPSSGVGEDGCVVACDGIQVTVTSGPAGAPATLTARKHPDALTNAYNMTMSVASDPDGHDPSIFNAGAAWPDQLPITLDVTLTDGDPTGITIEGPSPWVTVTGTLEGDAIGATGTGTVAGIDGIAVILGGTLREGGIQGYYEVGAEGGLTGGDKVVYYLWPGTRVDDGGPDPHDFIVELPADLPNGTYTVEIDVPDTALLEPNVTTIEFTFVVER